MYNAVVVVLIATLFASAAAAAIIIAVVVVNNRSMRGRPGPAHHLHKETVPIMHERPGPPKHSHGPQQHCYYTVESDRRPD